MANARSLSFPIAALCAALMFTTPAVQAQPAPDQPVATESKKDRIASERKAAGDAAEKAMVHGPSDIKLVDQAMLKLPKGYAYVPKEEALRWMRATGNHPSNETIGILVSDGAGNWWATLEFNAAGYVKDEDAKSWNADELLNSMKEATEAGNADRIERGFPAIEITGWIEKPAYFPENQRLIWSALVRQKGGGDDGSVNYNTYALGRDGYFSLDLITSQADIGKDKADARVLLAAIEYLPGKAYADFNAQTDHIAEYGLAALIGGVAAKKLGLLALAAAFVLKFAKIIGIAVIGFGAAAMRLFRRRNPEA